MSEVVELKAAKKPKAKKTTKKTAGKKVAKKAKTVQPEDTQVGPSASTLVASDPVYDLEGNDITEAYRSKANEPGSVIGTYKAPKLEFVDPPVRSETKVLDEVKAETARLDAEEAAAAYYAKQPLKYGFFERQYDNLRFWLGQVYNRVPRLVWVGQRIEIDVRWDPNKGQITVHYLRPFKKAK